MPAIPTSANIAKHMRSKPFTSVRIPLGCALVPLVLPRLSSLRGVERFDCIFCPLLGALPFFSSAIFHSKTLFLSYTLALYYTIFTYESISNILKAEPSHKKITLSFTCFPSFHNFPFTTPF